MRTPRITKIQVVFSLACLITLAFAEWGSDAAINVRRPGGAIICVVLCIAGFFIWWRGKAHAVEEIPPVFQGEPLPQPPLPAFFKRARYWGAMLVLSALILTAAGACRFPVMESPPTAPKPVRVRPAKPEFVFPQVRLEILIVNGGESMISIDGEGVARRRVHPWHTPRGDGGSRGHVGI